MKKYSYLTAKETNAVKLLMTRLKQELADQMVQLKLFGSKAKGDFTADSDVDILLIVKDRTDAILDKIAAIHLDIDLKYDPNISLIIFSEFEYEQNHRLNTPFIKSIQNESIAL